MKIVRGQTPNTKTRYLLTNLSFQNMEGVFPFLVWSSISNVFLWKELTGLLIFIYNYIFIVIDLMISLWQDLWNVQYKVKRVCCWESSSIMCTPFIPCLISYVSRTRSCRRIRRGKVYQKVTDFNVLISLSNGTKVNFSVEDTLHYITK